MNDVLTENNEEWKPVAGYEGIYEVSNLGKIRTIPRKVKKWDGERTLLPIVRKTFFSPGGYERSVLSLNGVNEKVLVHRIVAGAFIENPYNKPDVNHKNGIKSDNTVNNLEWVTKKENIRHAFDVLKRTPSRTGHNLEWAIRNNKPQRKGKSIICTNREDGTKINFNRMTDAAIFFKRNISTINYYLNGRIKHKEYIFKYKK